MPVFDKKIMSSTIATNLVTFRQNLGWDQQTLAKEAGLTPAALSKIENRVTGLPSLENIHRLSEALGISISVLLGDTRDVEAKIAESRLYLLDIDSQKTVYALVDNLLERRRILNNL